MSLMDLIKKNEAINGDGKDNKGYIEEIRMQIQNNPISDITDKDGNQYIDIVLEGGGVLGIALIGYTYTLEQAGIRFLNIAGTSAGAINALFLAALGKPDSLKSQKILEIFNEMDMKSFVDGGVFAKGLVDDIKTKDNIWTAMLPKIGLLWAEGKFSKAKLGINPGKAFEEWLGEKLKEHGVTTTNDLLQNLINPNDLQIKDPARQIDEQEYFTQNFKKNELAIVSADITTQTKVIFPKMAALYWENPLTKELPAKFVRASMSIPLFFQPLVVPDIPKDNKNCWKTLTGYEGEIPSSVHFVDGGIVSNFPIDVFHRKDRIPLCPTFGVKLGVDRNEPRKMESMGDFVGALFDTARHTSDYSFLFQNTDYQKLIAYIDTSEKFERKKLSLIEKIKPKNWFSKNDLEDYHWLDFGMSDEKKVALFTLGAKTAYEFIVGNEKIRKNNSDKSKKIYEILPFDWKDYKNIRAECKITYTLVEISKRKGIENYSIR
ncbi:patatin-like phospholipase family protein [Acinetobacter higginsii]|uniref:patatin-like phospholipase family protein n=1 Tax=Acinetobacter higginsii TaxID=70347 RepID=UPI00320A1C43